MEEAIESLVTSTVTKLLEEAGFKQPPVNPLLIGAHHGIYFMVRPLPEANVEYKTIRHEESWVVTLNGDPPPDNQTVAAARAISSILINIPEDLNEVREEIIERGAEEILMPKPWFEESIKSFGYDVPALKRRFGVTYEVVAVRTLQFRKSILTIFDGLEVVKRVASRGLDASAEPSLAEKEILQRALESSTYQRASDSNALIECHPIPLESGIQRVFCFKVPK